MKRFWALLTARVKILLRDRTSMFFAFLFPIVLVLFFGTVLSNQGKITLNLSVYKEVNNYWVDEAFNIISASDVFAVDEVDDVDSARDQVRRGKIDYLLVFRENDYGGVELNVEYGLKGVENYQAVIGPVMEGVVQQANFGGYVWDALQRGEPDVINRLNNYTLRDTLISDSEADPIVVGMNGWILQSLILYTIVGLSRLVAEEKELKLLKRLAITNVKKWQYLSAYVVSFMIIGFLQTLILLAMAYGIFDIQIQNLPWYLLATAAINFMIAMIGLLVGSVSKTPTAAAGLSQLIGFPLILLAGAWFPMSLFPAWLQDVARFSPLTQAKFFLDQIGAVHVPEVQLATVLALVGTTAVFATLSLLTFRFTR
jgi:ABC-2 type transport system permease protein